MKLCSKCQLPKDGNHVTQCKACCNNYMKERAKLPYCRICGEDKHGYKSTLCRTCTKLKRKKPEIDAKENARVRARNYWLIHRYDKYGINVHDYNQLLTQQNGVCAICKQNNTSNRKLAVDHDHVTGKVRGLLCDTCNRGLGYFYDNRDYLIAATDYITDRKALA